MTRNIATNASPTTDTARFRFIYFDLSYHLGRLNEHHLADLFHALYYSTGMQKNITLEDYCCHNTICSFLFVNDIILRADVRPVFKKNREKTSRGRKWLTHLEIQMALKMTPIPRRPFRHLQSF